MYIYIEVKKPILSLSAVSMLGYLNISHNLVWEKGTGIAWVWLERASGRSTRAPAPLQKHRFWLGKEIKYTKYIKGLRHEMNNSLKILKASDSKIVSKTACGYYEPVRIIPKAIAFTNLADFFANEGWTREKIDQSQRRKERFQHFQNWEVHWTLRSQSKLYTYRNNNLSEHFENYQHTYKSISQQIIHHMRLSL